MSVTQKEARLLEAVGLKFSENATVIQEFRTYTQS
jgi:hypothetical protein